MSAPRRGRDLLLTGLVVALLVAGVGSYYASSHPDGLERVAEQTGFSASAEDSPAEASPFAGYTTDGVEDERLGGGLAGVVGTLAVLVLAGILFRLLRRRAPETGADPADSEA